MEIQRGTLTVSNYNNGVVNYSGVNNKPGKAGTGILSSNSQFDKMIESIQEQIQKIQENDRYDADTKKSKIVELEKQLKEIEKARADESVLGSTQSETNKIKKNDSFNDESNGVSVDISFDAKALLEADSSLKQLKDAGAAKTQLKGEANVLASEIKLDKGRGVDTAKKEERLAGIKESVEKSMENMGEAAKDISNAVNDMSVDTSDTDNASRLEDSRPAEINRAENTVLT